MVGVQERIWKRLALATGLMLALHLLFLFFITPLLELGRARYSRTEVVQISPGELDRLKERILRDKHKLALLKEEIREEFKSKEAPKDAKMVGQFNQVVPKERLARAQHEAPREAGGRPQRPAAQAARPQLRLSNLGLGNRVPKPRVQPDEAAQPAPSAPAGPVGPPGTYRPRGLQRDGGDQNLLNAVESKYYSFFARLEEPIVRNWFFLLQSHGDRIRAEMAAARVKAGDELPITVEFVLDQAGSFVTIRVIESSGIPTLDWATKESVQKLGSLPNPPPALFEESQYYTRRLRFMVHVSEAPVINTRPDLRW